MADLGEGPGGVPPLFWVKKERMTEERKAKRASKSKLPPPSQTQLRSRSATGVCVWGGGGGLKIPYGKDRSACRTLKCVQLQKVHSGVEVPLRILTPPSSKRYDSGNVMF